MRAIKIPEIKNKNGEIISHKEQLKNILVAVFFLYAFAVIAFLVWYIFEPTQVIPYTSDFYVSRVSYKADQAKEEKKTIKPIVPEKSIPGIKNFKGNPNFDKNINKYDEFLKKAARKYNLSCTLVKAYMMAESRGNPKAKSYVGAQGLMQLMPATAAAMGYPKNLKDPLTSIMAGAKYISHLENTCCHEKPRNDVCDPKKDIKYSIAAYNGGSRCNKPALYDSCTGQTNWECLIFDGYGETRNYVNKVKANYHHLKNNGWGCD